MRYQKLSLEQIKVVTNATAVFESYRGLTEKENRYKGSMHWKRIGGRDYLYRGFSYGRVKSLGRRSPKTEDLKRQFDEGRTTYLTEKKSLRDALLLHAGYIRLNRLNRFPLAGARVIRAFEQQGIPIRIIGTHALYAYEMGAGVLFLPEYLATEDIDILMDDRQAMKIVSSLNKRTLLSILRASDPSFNKVTSSDYEFAARNASGYRVELITQGRSDPSVSSRFLELLENTDIKPSEIDILKWHVSSPPYREVVFDQRGMPVWVPTVDPRSFVIHKWYVSHQDTRKPIKQKRDLAQAEAVADVIENEFSHLPKSPAIRRLFPQSVVESVPFDTDKFSI